MRAVFICSAGHSGSTLLDLLLGSHPEAASLGEITHLPKNLALNTPCTCGKPARECDFWSRVVDELSDLPKLGEIRSNPYVLHLGMINAVNIVDRRQQTTLRELHRKVVYALAHAHMRWGVPVPSTSLRPLSAGSRNKLTLFDVVSKVTSRSVLIDSSKHYLEAVSLYEHAPERVRIVLLVRDGRAVYYSGLKRGQDRKLALRTWQATYRRALPILRRRIPAEHLIQVRYEDLSSDPERELRRICTFIGVAYTPEMLAFSDKAHHILNGNRMRFGSSGITPDLSWREKLSPRDISYFDMRAGRLNRELGYA